MKVHLVMKDSSGWVMGRLASYLTAMGWDRGDGYDSSAEWNILFPYLEGHKRGIPPRTAAWFTHREENEKNKAAIWDDIAERVALRLTSAQRYATSLSLHGKSLLVTPPVEQDVFYPAPRIPNKKPVIGLSGRLYATGRKGEGLVKQLVASPLFKEIGLTAAGYGWPIPAPTQKLSWSAMPDWYRGLDVYLCTATVEGIPLPPLEALSCGIKVVIPKGVGMLDDLPVMPGIERYERGDYAGMENAIRRAIESRADPDALRQAVSEYTVAAWQQSWRSVLGDTHSEERPVPPTVRLTKPCGVCYVAYGEEATTCLRRALTSWKKYMPDVPSCVISAQKPDMGEDVWVKHDDTDIGARSVKTLLYGLTPPEWENVLYLDADTELVAPVHYLFSILEHGWDMAICLNPPKYILASQMERPDNRDEVQQTIREALYNSEALQYNGGVIGFRRSERMARLWREWHKEWQRWGKRDQAALDRALYAAPVAVWTLNDRWNTVAHYNGPEYTAGIMHYPRQARRWKGLIAGRLDSDEAWSKVNGKV